MKYLSYELFQNASYTHRYNEMVDGSYDELKIHIITIYKTVNSELY